MPKITLKPLDDGQKSVEIPIGKTTIGRGPFLGCGDKKVSRNHAVLEVTEQGEVFLTPTHVNPCFFQPTADSPGTILKKDKPHKLEHGDSFSLLPRAFRYEVVMVEEVTSTSTENENEGTDAKTEEKVNGTSEEKERCRDENRDSKGDSKSEQEEETLSTNCQQNSKDALLPEAEDSSQNKEEEEGEDEEEEEEEEDEEEEPPKEKKPTPLNIERKPDVEFNGDDVKEPTKEQIPADVKPELPKVESDAKKKEPTECKEEEEEEEVEDQEAGGSDARTERTLPDWMVELSSPQKGQKKVLKTAKQHRREKTPGKRKKDVEEKPRRKKKELERVSEDEVVNVRVSSNQRPSSGRSSRTNRQTRQGLSLDDFVASDDDEEWPSDESEPRLKKKRRSRRKDDDSGSDWEIEHKRAKRVSHKFSSGSESGSDWRTNSPRKKKAPRGRRRRSKRTKEEEVISDDDDDEKSQPGKQSKRTPCSFGKKCYRKNAGHLDQFSHPGDSDFESEAEEKQNDLSESGEESDNLKECPFGVNCYRKNPQHKKEFKHTKKVRPQREAAKHSDKKSKGSDENDEPDAYDLNDSFLNDESDEYKPVDSGSEYESNHDVKRLPPTKATTKRVTKNKRAKRV